VATKDPKAGTRMDGELLRRVKRVSVSEGRPIYECLEEAAREWLAHHERYMLEEITRPEDPPKRIRDAARGPRGAGE
jgi:hypothetical protein